MEEPGWGGGYENILLERKKETIALLTRCSLFSAGDDADRTGVVQTTRSEPNWL